MSLKSVSIYGLIDPRNNEIRYVGKTQNKIKNRYHAHVNPNNKSKTYCAMWIRGLRYNNALPELLVLEIVGPDEWVEAEAFWISYFKFIGARLTNHSNGGEGIPGHKDSAESRLKKSIAMQGRKKTKEHIAKMNLFKPGHKHNVGIPRLPETKRKLSETQKGRKRPEKTEEQKQNHLKGVRKSWTPEKLENHRKNQLNNPERIAKFRATMRLKYDAGWCPNPRGRPKKLSSKTQDDDTSI